MMTPVTLTILVTLLSALSTASYGRVLVGGKTEVPDVRKNKEVQELGRFAVDEYNRGLRGNDDVKPLKFVEVVEAQQQVVSGVKYYLNIAATRDGSNRMFTSLVVVKPWLESKKLLHFGPLSTSQQDM